jgi:hypothetical protein
MDFKKNVLLPIVAEEIKFRIFFLDFIIFIIRRFSLQAKKTNLNTVHPVGGHSKKTVYISIQIQTNFFFKFIEYLFKNISTQ